MMATSMPEGRGSASTPRIIPAFREPQLPPEGSEESLAGTCAEHAVTVDRARRWLGIATSVFGAIAVIDLFVLLFRNTFLWVPSGAACAVALLVRGLLDPVSSGLRAPRTRPARPMTAGQYLLKERIGTGAMGNVWSAVHPALKHDVAIKIMRPDCTTPAMITRFEREILAMTRLSHPNTVRVLDCGTTAEGLLYFVMEHVAGDTLKKLVEREGPLPPARAIHIVRQTARALAEAHSHGITHRDIKPDNILVTAIGGETDFVKVLDFGIAKYDVHDTGLTHAGMLVGTPTYLSPEQAATKPVDGRSDLYSLGAVLFFALTGRPPFEGSMSTLLLAHLAEIAPLPSSCSPHYVTPALDSVVRRCLSKSPASRYATALDLEVALARTLAEGGDFAPISTRLSPSMRPLGLRSPSMRPVSIRPLDRDLPTVRPGPAASEPAAPVLSGIPASQPSLPLSGEQRRSGVVPAGSRGSESPPPSIQVFDAPTGT